MTIYAIGEALIDFVPNRSGNLTSDIAFVPAVGGAPLNVAAAIAKLGGNSAVLTQVGRDDFGDLIVNTAKSVGIDTTHLLQTHAAKTALAFVTLADDGERSFSFYRNPSADMLYSADNLAKILPQAEDCLHFCSVSLAPDAMRQAHEVAIAKWREAGATISFDINIRLPLWDNEDACRNAVNTFIPKADIIKISDDELPFVTGEANIQTGIDKLFTGHVRYVIYTRGRNGAQIYNKNGLLAEKGGRKVDAIDATGAGDGFTGAILYQLQQQSLNTQADWSKEQAGTLLDFATIVGALATLKRGAINSLPTLDEVNAFDS